MARAKSRGLGNPYTVEEHGPSALPGEGGTFERRVL